MIPLWLASGLIGAAVAGGAAWRVQDWRHDAAELARVADAVEVGKLRARTADGASASHESFKEGERVRYLTITKTVDRIIDRPIYRAECFDADGVQQLNAAITGHDDSTGKPAPAVP